MNEETGKLSILQMDKMVIKKLEMQVWIANGGVGWLGLHLNIFHPKHPFPL